MDGRLSPLREHHEARARGDSSTGEGNWRRALSRLRQLKVPLGGSGAVAMRRQRAAGGGMSLSLEC